ncbi:hypothetical protein C4566_00130 [Candidatus Parcubacteria bacterium]|nr:MAG: hypothetical protein C4566_00130 [Candidatus Parcubacteria bacterium]
MNKNRLINLTPIILFLFAYTLMGANDFFGLEYFKTFFLVLFFPLFIVYLILEIKEKGGHKSFFIINYLLFCFVFCSLQE